MVSLSNHRQLVFGTPSEFAVHPRATISPATTLAGIHNMGGAAVANFCSILERAG